MRDGNERKLILGLVTLRRHSHNLVLTPNSFRKDLQQKFDEHQKKLRSLMRGPQDDMAEARKKRSKVKFVFTAQFVG